MMRKINDNFYGSSTLKDLNDDFKLFLENYLEKGKGSEKLRVLIEFVIEKHPELLKSLSNKIGKENESKITTLNEKIQLFISQNEIQENELKHLNESKNNNFQEVILINN
jgi:hypothetical protein